MWPHALSSIVYLTYVGVEDDDVRIIEIVV
jgi:hypothetical protein